MYKKKEFRLTRFSVKWSSDNRGYTVIVIPSFTSDMIILDVVEVHLFSLCSLNWKKLRNLSTTNFFQCSLRLASNVSLSLWKLFIWGLNLGNENGSALLTDVAISLDKNMTKENPENISTYEGLTIENKI